MISLRVVFCFYFFLSLIREQTRWSMQIDIWKIYDKNLYVINIDFFLSSFPLSFSHQSLPNHTVDQFSPGKAERF